MERKLSSVLFMLGCFLQTTFGKTLSKQLCDPREYAKAIPDDPNKFLQCVNVVAHIGEWGVRQCPPGFVFEATKQRCKSAEAVRRLQSLCQLDPTTIGCPQVAGCPTNVVNPMAGGSCYWPTARLAPVAGFQNSFLQCIPTTTENQCGTWSQMSCPEGTTFQTDLQICVTVNLQNTCQQMTGSMAYPVCPCMSGGQCPGTTHCSSGVCCAVIIIVPTGTAPTPRPPQPPQLPYCPNGQIALSFCQSESQCPPGYTCLSGACCQQVAPPLPMCPSGQVAISACTGYGQGTCPQMYECINGGCCPVQLPVCPNGIQAVQTCTDDFQCPPQHACINRGCCKLTICPGGMAASQFCQGFGQSNCPSGMHCVNGGCCPLPTCPNGQIATQVCMGTGQAGCPYNQICYNGGCCPLPVCPGGSPCAGFCGSGISCPSGHVCVQGGCCPIPICSNGQPATSTCVLSSDCPTGFQCENGGCCPIPLPTCPTGQLAVSPCTGPGTCNVGFYCYLSYGGQQGCCPIPVCPNGQLALQLCDATTPCPVGYNCINSGCCPIPLPTCPNGQQAVSVCSSNQQCPAGFSCIGGGCCPTPVPTCPSGQPAISICGAGRPCPPGYNCINGGCCPAPTPTCPGGQVAVSSCSPGGVCPSGFVCISGACCPAPSVICPNGKSPTQKCDAYGRCPPGYFCVGGYCCEQTVAPPPQPGPVVCPVQMIPICFCATINLICPTTSVCNMGYCCASATSSLAISLLPGASCKMSSQCAGYPQTGHCSRGRCMCLDGTRSNGLTCINYPSNVNALNACDQFGTPCSTYFFAKTLRRKAGTEEMGITSTTQPLWWETISSNCVTDSECTLDKTCIKDRCHKLVKLNEYGCQYSEQCSRLITDAFCSLSGNSKLGQCRCKKELYEFENECVKACPNGTYPSAGECLPEHNFQNKALINDWVKKITLVLYANDTIGSSPAKKSITFDH